MRLTHFCFLHSSIQYSWDNDLYVYTVFKERKCDLRHLAKLFVIIVVTDIYKQGFQLLRVLLKNATGG